ncbi:tetratricopeptide repeat protein [Maricaulis sp. W15]|uniref:tetratricopeptide repeat protein n=1 Tax=Maricaulis sp. W15 TaxID=1772333 RepID=UPI000AA74411
MRYRTYWGCLVLIGVFVASAWQAAAQSDDSIEDLLERGRYANALQQAHDLSATGDAVARSWLAHIYRQGLGVPQDLSRAIELDRASAEAGVARSQNALGHSLIMGLGVEADISAGQAWLHRAAQTGAAQYEFDYARSLTSELADPPDFVEAAVWYQRAADQGFIEAQTNLGILYMTGQGVSQDVDRARAFFLAAANAGDAQAQNNLGLLHVRGDGVPRDYDAAFNWFRLAAEQDLPQALRNLSVLYESGQGAPVDEERARRLLARARALEGGGLEPLLSIIGFPFDPRLHEPDWDMAPDSAEIAAVLGGDPVAVYIQGQRFMRGGSERQDFRLAFSSFEAAARHGMSGAEFSLCLLHANGWGAPQNYRSAYVWCSLAAYRGYPDADVLRDNLALRMTAAQIDAARREIAQRLSQD